MNMEQLEAKYLSKDRVMTDGELMEATRMIRSELNPTPKSKFKDEFGLPMTLTERILRYVKTELEKEGIKNEGLDKELYNNELITRTKKWWIKARK